MLSLPMQVDLENAVLAGKLTPEASKALEGLPPGTYCFHKSWGFGQVAGINFLLNQIIIDFKSKKGHVMQPQYAAESLVPLDPEYILVRKVTHTEEVRTQAREDAAGLVRIILQSYGGKATQDQIAQALAGEIFNESEFKRWWDATRKLLKKDSLIAFPTKKSEPVVLREEAISHADELLEAFRSARRTKDLIAALDQIVRHAEEFSPQQLAPVIATVEDTAQKQRRLETAQALELILGRNELQEATGLAPAPGAIRFDDIFRDEERRLHEILNEVAAAKQRRMIAAYPGIFGEEWAEKLVELMSHGSVRVVSEGARLLLENRQEERLRRALQRWISDHTISTEILTWLCKEREGVFADFVDAELLSAVLSALERDQFNESKRGGKLRDILIDDRELIPDMLANAEPETVRDTIRKVMLSGVFEELSKRSLLGRIVRVFPDMESMLTGGETTEKQEALIVSWESLEKRKTEYEDLINKKIPENTKEISVARSYGDLRENFEFKAAKEMQRVLMRRKSETERDLAVARGTDFANPDTTQVSIGTVVTLRNTVSGKEKTYTILGAWDSDPAAGIISYKAAIAQALLGHKVGEELTIPSEHGENVVSIVSIAPYRKSH